MSADPIFDSYLDGAPSGGVFDPINLNLYHYSHNNPIIYIDPNGLLNVGLHGGAAGAYNSKKPNKTGSAGMINYVNAIKKTLGITEDFLLPNFEYNGLSFNANYTEGSKFLSQITDWDKNGNNILVGWSIGADGCADFLATTDVKFKLIILDAAQTKLLPAGVIEKISKQNLTKNGRLIIVQHLSDYMDGNSISKLLGGGDRIFDDYNSILPGMNDSPENIYRAQDEYESKKVIKKMKNVKIYDSYKSHNQDIGKVNEALKDK